MSSPSVAMRGNAVPTTGMKRVILASSLGTVFEWYDFYLYGSLAAIIAKQFFSASTRPAPTSAACSPSPPALPCAPSAPCCSAPGRPGGPQVHLPHHHRHHGPVHLPVGVLPSYGSIGARRRSS